MSTTTADVLKATVVGFLIPVYIEDHPTIPGEKRYGLDTESHAKVVAGYACPRCLAEFASYTAACVLCHWQRDVARDIEEAPEFWKQTVDERENDRTPYARPSANPFDEMMRTLTQDPDVDHVALSDLAKKRRVRRS